jgi:uncharacterized membrane protein YfcA
MAALATPSALRQLRPFFFWLALFYTAWASIVTFGQLWPTVAAHWPMTVTMLFGSYVAGSTPMGGGTVGFPVLVLLFNQDPTLGRDFSFAVQSIGMTSASVFILCKRVPVATTLLCYAILGSALGTPLGILTFAPLVEGEAVKVVFAVLWASFGVLTLLRLREMARLDGLGISTAKLDRQLGLAVGLFGGYFIASATGVGIDMLIYCVLVLVCRCDLKTAVPTSVILMAFNSLIGIATKALLGTIKPGVFENWLAAAPVVALGAPLGALVVNRVGRVPTLLVVSILCMGQFIWTYYAGWSNLGITGLAIGIAGLLLCQGLFELMYRAGRRLLKAQTTTPPA